MKEPNLSLWDIPLGVGKIPTQKSRIDPTQIKRGIEVEKEHTKKVSVARKIAMDHLKEDPDYYKKLKSCFGENH